MLFLRFCVGFDCLALAVVPLLLFFGFAFGVGAYPDFGGFASFLVSRLVLGLFVRSGFSLVFSYSCTTYIDQRFKLTMSYRRSSMSRKMRILRRFLTVFK